MTEIQHSMLLHPTRHELGIELGGSNIGSASETQLNACNFYGDIKGSQQSDPSLSTYNRNQRLESEKAKGIREEDVAIFDCKASCVRRFVEVGSDWSFTSAT